jgi:hypothetical protein
MVIFFSKFRKNYKELSGLPKVWIRMNCTIWLFSPKCVSVLGKEKCAENPNYIWTKCLLMFCFNPKFSSFGGNMNNLKKMYVTEMYDIAKSGINHYVPVFGYYFRKKFTGGNVWRLEATKTKKRGIQLNISRFL